MLNMSYGINRQKYSNSRGSPLLPMERLSRKENIGIETHFRTNGLIMHKYIIPCQSSRIHALAKCTQNIFPDRRYDRTLNKS